MITVSNPEKLAFLFELSRAFSALTALDELLPLVNRRTREVLDAESCAILLLDDTRTELYFPITADLTPEIEERLRKVRTPIASGIAGAVVREGRPAMVNDVSRDERFNPEVDRQSGAHTRSILYAPLRTHEGVIGVIGLRNKQSGDFDDEDLAFLDALAGSVAVSIENARLYARLLTSEEHLRTQVHALRRDIARRDRFADMIGTGPAMAEVFRMMETAATSPIAVLIEGETGTGKELVARGIHRASERADEPFLAVNCAALPETLLESELFGHRRGAFTGAIRDRRGLFEAANGGTIFLDEIGEMPPAMQAKLLRVLQNREIIPVGETRPRAVDVRVLSATNRDLRAEVAAKRFREDLYYRVAAFPIRVPPLRERREDVPLLAARVLAAAAERHGKRVDGIDAAAIEAIERFDWPGNVRELENEIERAVALVRDGRSIGIAELSAKLDAAGPDRAVVHSSIPGAELRTARAAVEARCIREVLEKQAGNVTRAARALGVSRVTLYKKMRTLGVR